MSVPAVSIVDDISPEDIAMVQALYSRSPESSSKHLEKVRKTGNGKFMSSYYVGYGHKSIGDCGSTTIFIEDVSLLAAKAIQDWPLYSGQETSTRYIDMRSRDIIDPVGTSQSRSILDRWMNFYIDNQSRVLETIKIRHPIRDGEDPKVYEKAAKARVFDIMRGFLPAGITTQLSWHTNLRQAGDHLIGLRHHPSKEISTLAEKITDSLNEKYPSSGFKHAGFAAVSGTGTEGALDRAKWEQNIGTKFAYAPPMFPRLSRTDAVIITMSGAVFDEVQHYIEDINSRPRGCVLPHFMSDFGQISWSFYLDFGSFRDIQRHRNGICRMPLLTDNYGFEPWYLDQLDEELRDEAKKLLAKQEDDIARVTDNDIARQYYLALGYRVRTDVTYSLPAAVYVMELRSSKTVHPTLRKKIHEMIDAFKVNIPNMVLHTDLDPSDWDIRRGTQTITEK